MRIEKGVPIPIRKSRAAKYPFPDMEVGDSVLIPGVDAIVAMSAYLYHAKRHDKKFTSRKTAKGLRVWRTA